jgi:hypothetical protein
MKPIGQFFANFFDRATSERQKIQREWDKQRARAMSPSELSDIDAIFARHL